MDPRDSFQLGEAVIYGMHGKCEIIGIETRETDGQSVAYYKLEIQRSPLSRSTRHEPAIWVPVTSAREKGMRPPIQACDSEAIYEILNSREYYFSIQEPWSALKPRIENSIRIEGGLGLAKALSYLHVLKRKQIVASPEVNRMYEAVSKLLIRELNEATSEPTRNIEDRIAKSLRHKLIPSN